MDKRTIEMLEKRRNWAFTDAEALSTDKTLESMFGIKTETENLNKSQTSIGKYYENLDPKRKSASSPLEDALDPNRARNFAATNGMAGFGRFQSDNDVLLKKGTVTCIRKPICSQSRRQHNHIR